VLSGVRSRFRAAAGQVSSFPRVWRLVWEAAPGWTVGWACILLLLGCAPLATVALTKRLVDSLVAATHSNSAWQNTRGAIVAGVLIAATAIASELLQGLLDWVKTAQSELIQDHISGLVHRQSLRVDLAFYESPEYFDCLYRARDEAATRPAALLENLGGLLQNSVTLLGLSGLVLTYGVSLVAAMILGMLPAIFVVVRYNWLNHDWWRSTTEQRRWIQYYDQKLTSPICAAELRLLGLGGRFVTAWKGLRHGLRSQKLDLVRRQNLARIGAALLSLTAGALALAWMSWRTLRGHGTLGDIILFYQALMGSQSLVRAMTGNLGQVYNNSLFLSSLFEFLDLQPAIVESPLALPAPASLSDGIRFENVSFRYPGSERAALSNFDLYLPANKVVAIVGPNGAGKSTLLKLLARFYDPAEGRITLDGTDIRDLSLEELRRMVSVLFQMPVTYDASAAENIAIGDLSRPYDADSIRDAAVNAGAHEVISRLPRGYETPLGKSFAMGNDLSAGEWQRIAMARAFLRQAPLLLLDEPTSFMDSWAEAEWFDRLRRLALGRTAVVITHRFTIAMRADLIHVMHSGRVLQSGTHSEMIQAGGLYADSWRQQMDVVPSESTFAAA
jgi:ATP-binding cassette subfamily B protein